MDAALSIENLDVEAIDSLSDDEIDALKAALRQAEEEKAQRLDMLGVQIAGLRSEAISARASSGIEDVWREDEEFYHGIDDRNRGDSGSWQTKPPGRVTPNPNNGSNLFLNVTSQYVDAAAASIGDMLMPTDDNAWSISNTPVPALIDLSEGKIPADIQTQIRRNAQMTGQDPGQALEAAGEKIARQAHELVEKSRQAAEKAQKRIEDWQVESQYTAEVRKVIEDAARIGSGVLKGPVPQKVKTAAYKDGAIHVEEKIVPVSISVSPWNCFPDGGCGESIHDGGYFFERDYITPKKLKRLLSDETYIGSQIEKVLAEGPGEAGKEAPDGPEIEGDDERKNDKLFEIWYFYGELSKEALEAADCPCENDEENAHLVMVNNRVIKATTNILDDGEFPYDVMVWKRRGSGPWGTGVSRLIREPQRMINGAVRNLMDNAGMAGGPMWAYRRGLISPLDGKASLAPRKGWVVNEDADIDDVQRAFTYFRMDMMVNELQAIIMMGLRFAEDVTGLPMILQGQMGASSPDTLGQTQILNNNASTVRRRIARLFDDKITEPHIRRYYKYLLQYGPDDDEKGEFQIDARGSSNLVERSIQKEQIMEMGQMALNPVYGIDPKKWANEYLRAQRFDPAQFEYDDEEWKQIVARMSQPSDSRIAAEQIRAQTSQAVQESRERIEISKLEQKDAGQAREHDHELMIQEVEQAFEAELQKLKQAGVKDNILDESKVRINETVMKLRTQKELAGVMQVVAPAAEPPGRAEDGHAFSQ